MKDLHEFYFYKDREVATVDDGGAWWVDDTRASVQDLISNCTTALSRLFVQLQFVLVHFALYTPWEWSGWPYRWSSILNLHMDERQESFFMGNERATWIMYRTSTR